MSFVRAELQLKVEPSWGSMENREWDTRIWISDPSRIRLKLGWLARYTVEEGFRQLVHWIRELPEVRAFYD